jgi:hypothetical protein
MVAFIAARHGSGLGHHPDLESGTPAMLSGQEAIRLLTVKASRWATGAVARVDRPGASSRLPTTHRAAGNARQVGFYSVSSQMGAVTDCLHRTG